MEIELLNLKNGEGWEVKMVNYRVWGCFILFLFSMEIFVLFYGAQHLTQVVLKLLPVCSLSVNASIYLLLQSLIIIF